MKNLITLLLILISIVSLFSQKERNSPQWIFNIDGGYTFNHLPHRADVTPLYFDNQKFEFSVMRYYDIDNAGFFISGGIGHYRTNIENLKLSDNKEIRNSTLSASIGFCAEHNWTHAVKLHYSFRNIFFLSYQTRLYIFPIYDRLNIAPQLEIGNSNYAGWFIMPSICLTHNMSFKNQ